PAGPALFVSIWGSAPNDVYVTGGSGDATRPGIWRLHYDGRTWTSTMSPGLRIMWGSSAQDIYGADSVGAIYHFDGSSWTPITGPSGKGCFGFWGATPDNLYCSTSDELVWHFDGNSW